MNDVASRLEYPWQAPPEFGDVMEVASGVYWLQMPLPMSLKYINLYLLDDNDGWTVVDTGIRGEDTRELWDRIGNARLGGKPITRVICTHMHPDHTGQAGYLCERWQAPLFMSYSEYYQARSMGNMFRDGGNWQMTEYFERAGIEAEFLAQMRESRSSFTPEPEDRPIPPSFVRLTDGDTLDIGDNTWLVMTGSGHSPEHVCLYCKSLRVLISGDQILPVIVERERATDGALR